MNIVDFVRLALKHIRLLILIPILLATLVIILTVNPSFEYSSQTILYTGLATGTSIEMDKRFDHHANSAAFDNLINIIKSRDTQEEVAIRLLAQHLMLKEANSKYISEEHYEEFIDKIPEDLRDYVAVDRNAVDVAIDEDNVSALFPEEIDPVLYEQTVKNLIGLMQSNTSNFVYEIINYEKDKHYSIKAISSVNAMRIGGSDLVKLTYTVNDPGICQQTLDIYNKVCIKNYKFIKQNRSDDVVKYFEAQLAQASDKLKRAEDKLLEFNKASNIINYYEQSKKVAIVKEEMELDYNQKQAELAGLQAATRRMEKKLDIQEVIQQKSNYVLQKKKELGELNYEIAMIEAKLETNGTGQGLGRLGELRKQSDAVSSEIKKSVDELYSYENTVDGLPVTKVLPNWMDNVTNTENLRAKLKIMENQNKEFQKQYKTYAPAGANMLRIQREISVSEEGYLEILHGLNLAKLKLQDNSLSANLKAIDPPYFPLYPIPSKRKILIVVAAFIGGLFTLGIILVMEYFDDTLKNSDKAAEKIGIPGLGMIPKILLNPLTTKMSFVQSRLIEIITQNIIQDLSSEEKRDKVPKTILCFSTQKMEGKSVIAGNIAKGLKKSGKSVLVLNYSDKEPRKDQQRKYSILNRVLGYADPRIDVDNPFLANASEYLDDSEYHTYNIDKQFYKAKNYEDILRLNNIVLDYTPDYIVIELPSIIDNNHPTELFIDSDLDILVCRSNRTWSKADKAALDRLMPFSESKMKFVINGVELKEVERVLGDLPKKRTSLRKKMKSMFKLEFFSKNQI